MNDVVMPAAPRRMSETMAMRVVQRTSNTFRRLLGVIAALALVVFGWTYHQSRRLQAEVTNLREAMARGEVERRIFADRVEAERQRSVEERTQLQHQIDGEIPEA